jgi:hypothetical protein
LVISHRTYGSSRADAPSAEDTFNDDVTPSNEGTYRNVRGGTVASEKSENDVMALPRENAFPVFAALRGPGHPVYGLVPWIGGEMIADYVLFEASMEKARVPWVKYDALTTQEKTVYVEHMKALHARRLSYKCPMIKQTFKTVSQLLYEENCCGEGCRHCPYELEQCPDKVKKSLVWNGAFYI